MESDSDDGGEHVQNEPDICWIYNEGILHMEIRGQGRVESSSAEVENGSVSDQGQF